MVTPPVLDWSFRGAPAVSCSLALSGSRLAWALLRTRRLADAGLSLTPLRMLLLPAALRAPVPQASMEPQVDISKQLHVWSGAWAMADADLITSAFRYSFYVSSTQ